MSSNSTVSSSPLNSSDISEHIQETSPFTPSTPSTPSTSFFSKYKIVIIIGIILVLGIVGVLIWLFLKPSNQECASDEESSTMCSGGVAKCIKKCSNPWTYDCNSNACICPSSADTCGTGDSAICCPKGQCNVDANNNPFCCPTNQMCSGSCCTAGQYCNTTTNKCEKGCGPSDDGKFLDCTDNQTCVKIDNVLPATIEKIKTSGAYPGAIVNTANNTLFMCVDNNTCSGGNSKSSPDSIHNFYPCLNGTTTNADNFGVGFCYANNVTDIDACFGLDSADCNGKAGVCKFINLMDAVKTDPDLSKKMARMTSSVDKNTKIVNAGKGDYCIPDNVTSSSRVISYDLGKSCGWKDCWNKLSGNNVIDIDYDDATGLCYAIQDCTGGDSSLVSSNGSAVINPNQQNNQTGNILLQPCKSSTVNCSSLTQPGENPLKCDAQNGSITASISPTANTYKCDFTSSGTRECKQTADGSLSQSGCWSNIDSDCACPDGFSSGLINPDDPNSELQCFRKYPIKTKNIPVNNTLCTSGGVTCHTDWNVVGLVNNTWYNDGCHGGTVAGECWAPVYDKNQTVPQGTYYCTPPTNADGNGNYHGGVWTLCTKGPCNNAAYKKNFSLDGYGNNFSGCLTPCSDSKFCPKDDKGNPGVCGVNPTFDSSKPVSINNSKSVCM